MSVDLRSFVSLFDEHINVMGNSKLSNNLVDYCQESSHQAESHRKYNPARNRGSKDESSDSIQAELEGKLRNVISDDVIFLLVRYRTSAD